MDTPASSHPGLLGSLRGFADGVVGSVHDRLELFSVELHEEKHRLVQIVIWISALVVLGVLAIVFASLALVVLFWETARVAVVLSLAGGYLAGAVAVGFGFKRFLASQTKPFAGTLAELREDRACIREES